MIESFRPKNLQNLQSNEIQALIMILQYMIFIDTGTIDPVPPHE